MEKPGNVLKDLLQFFGHNTQSQILKLLHHGYFSDSGLNYVGALMQGSVVIGGLAY